VAAFLFLLSACTTAENITREPEDIQVGIPETEVYDPYDDRRSAAIDAALRTMSIDQKIAHLVVLEVPPLSDLGNPTVSALRRFFTVYYSRADFGGFILFGNNMQSREQLRTLSQALAALSHIPAWIMVDEEGGEISRITNAGLGAAPLPEPRTVGMFSSTDTVRNLGMDVGRDLRSLGITMNLAPVADVSPVGARRSYGADPSSVAATAVAFAQGLQSQGVAAVAKHFPGVGSVVGDPHLGPVSASVTPSELADRDLPPFRAAVGAGIDGVMTSHVTFAEICSEEPAGLSDCIVSDLLRGDLGFDGMVITDALNMGAMESEERVALRVLQAGSDLLLMPPNPQATVESLRQAVEAGVLTESRIDESLRRVLGAKIDRYVWVPEDPVLQDRYERWLEP
jgi:beta-N-acetylhexosaminidase